MALSPLLVLGGATVVVLLLAAFWRRHAVIAGASLLALAGAAAALPCAWGSVDGQVTPLMVIDGYTLLFTGLLLAATAAVVPMAHAYLARTGEEREELYVLLLLAALGGTVLVGASHFASLFLGLETMSVSLYGLIAYPCRRQQPIEAGLKYLVLAAASSAFLVFGMALLYARFGEMELAAVAQGVMRTRLSDAPLVLAGLVMTVVAVGFKLAVVPFHLWTPDVYQGAPSPVTAFVATVSKGAMFAVLLRYFPPFSAGEGTPLFGVFSVIAIASMFAGNLLALLQDNVKRVLAYSSIAHLGYLLVAFLAAEPASGQGAGEHAAEAIVFYLAAYFVTTLVGFGVITVLSDGNEEREGITEYQGLFWRRPWLAALMTAAMLSLAGIPLTAGFVGKFYVLVAGVESSRWLLLVVLLLNSTIGLYYYLRVVVVMLREPEADTIDAPGMYPAAAVTLGVLGVLLIGFGVFPSPLQEVIRTAVAALG